MPANRSFLSPSVVVLATTLIAMALYWPGLHGPYLLDDPQHVALIDHWLAGRLDLKDVMFGNVNWLMHRSLAMGSMALSAWLSGSQPFSYKLGNLLLHVACGWVAYRMLALLLLRDAQASARAKWIAALVSAMWLLHPLNVSTVLYPVQRMAQIATLFCLLGVWFYAHVRVGMIQGRIPSLRGMLSLLSGIAVLTLMGIQGKQNAVVLPGLCLVVEIAWFQRPKEWNRDMRIYFALSVGVPAVTACAGLAWKWKSLQAQMLDWNMTIGERLLSQARVLCDYMYMLIVPYSPRMGIFTDDFPISRGLLDPPATLVAILILLAISALALHLRRANPLIFAGWFWFLVAHSVEASFLPLELYYEHRNYLPAFGLFLALAGLLQMAGSALARRNIRVHRMGATLVLGLVLALSAQTLVRVQAWKHALSVAALGLETHPFSLRATWAFSNAAIGAGLPGDAYAAWTRLATADDPGLRGQAILGLTAFNCLLARNAPSGDVHRAVTLLPARINKATPYLFGNLLGIVKERGCGEVTPEVIGDAAAEVAGRAMEQPESNEARWAMRFNSALAYHQAGEDGKALPQARLAWQPGSDPSVATLLITLLAEAGEHREAERVFAEVVQRAGYDDERQIRAGARAAALRQMRRVIDQAPR